MTHLCVAIFVHDVAQAKRDIAQAAEAGADMVELRIDQFLPQSDEYAGRQIGRVLTKMGVLERDELLEALTEQKECGGLLGQILIKHGYISEAQLRAALEAQAKMCQDTISPLVKGAVLPCIVTCRPVWEGGHSNLEDGRRLQLLDLAISFGAAYADVELATYQRMGAFCDASAQHRMIVSSHDFQGRPDRLYNILRDLNEAPGDVSKIVWTARSIRDNLEAFEILKTQQKPTIALCMGEAGLISRILAKKFGGFLTFATLDGDAGTAPGQIGISDMKKLYRWDDIAPDTKVHGVVASPVMHSMSPAIHNAAFDATGHNGVYLPLLVAPGYESFKAFMETFVPFEGLDLSGLSVTLPHKENALRYLKEKNADVDPLAESIGSVNTIIIDRNSPQPKLRGINTDYAAILDCISAKLIISRDDLRGRRVAVIGAGGTGRTAVAALAHYGADVTVFNRTKERADALAAEFNGRSGRVESAALDELCGVDGGRVRPPYEIFINTTSVGMYPNVNESPLGEKPPRWGPDTLVFDTIYNPMKTKLLSQAEQAGAKTIGGVEMFLRQAVGQFQVWTGLAAPVEVMRRVIEHRLQSSGTQPPPAIPFGGPSNGVQPL